MALSILLYLALACASTVSPLLIQPSRLIQPPSTGSTSMPTLLNINTTHGRINKSLLSLPTDGMLDQWYNTSVSRLNLSADPLFDCDEGWGRNLNVHMCEEALDSIPWEMPPSTRPLSFGPREANTYDVGLPRRWMSSDGICGMQPFLLPGKTSAHLSPSSAFLGTSILIRRCVGGNPSKGGQARDLGGDENLLIAVTEFDPHLWSNNVRCFGSTAGAETIQSCNGLLDRMDASESSKVFGPRNTRHDYQTPYTIGADNRCYLKVTSHPYNRYARTASWYQIWEAAILLNAMCIRAGKKGTFKVFSDDMDFNWLQVEMGDVRRANDLNSQITSV